MREAAEDEAAAAAAAAAVAAAEDDAVDVSVDEPGAEPVRCDDGSGALEMSTGGMATRVLAECRDSAASRDLV